MSVHVRRNPCSRSPESPFNFTERRNGHDLERFLVRTVFCLFADDTGIFEPRDIFLDFIEERTAPDGSDLGPWLTRLFQVLDTPPHRRQAKLDEDLRVGAKIDSVFSLSGFDGVVPFRHDAVGVMRSSRIWASVTLTPVL